jgi:hypothetical protein
MNIVVSLGAAVGDRFDLSINGSSLITGGFCTTECGYLEPMQHMNAAIPLSRYFGSFA